MSNPTNRHTTIVRNTSGATQFFGYLPPHGVSLADGKDYEWPGDLITQIGPDVRKKTAFFSDWAAGVIQVVQSPTVLARDPGTGVFKEVTFSGGNVVASDVSYGSYSGSAPIQ